MKLRLFFSVLLLSLIPFISMGQTTQRKSESQCIPTRNVKERNLPFKNGENLEYVFHFQWGAVNSDVGRASITVDTLTYNGVPAFHSRIFGKTAKLYDMFFKVREDFQSWFTRDGLNSLKFTRQTNEGSYENRNTYNFVRKPNNNHIDADLYSSRRGYSKKTLPLTSCTYDIIALFFNIRNIDLTKARAGASYPITFAIDDDVYNVFFTYHGKEAKKIKGLGKVNCLKFSFNLIEGETFDAGQDMFVWVSDDDNRIPIGFECSIKLGKVTGRLETYSGLKYPFKSLEK